MAKYTPSRSDELIPRGMPVERAQSPEGMDQEEAVRGVGVGRDPCPSLFPHTDKPL